jgi:hypothetical protein
VQRVEERVRRPPLQALVEPNARRRPCPRTRSRPLERQASAPRPSVPPMDWQDDGYRAIGRWFVEFARLVGGMRANMEERLREPDQPEVAQLIFGAATAKQISDAFFAMCRLIGDFDEAETNVANQLQKAAEEEITRRNNIAHGDWIIGKGNDPATAQTALVRVHPNRRKPPHNTKYTSTDLDDLSERLGRLCRMTWVFGMIVLGGPIMTTSGRVMPGGTYRVSDVLIVKNVPRSGKGGDVVVGGPRASEIF